MSLRPCLPPVRRSGTQEHWWCKLGTGLGHPTWADTQVRPNKYTVKSVEMISIN